MKRGSHEGANFTWDNLLKDDRRTSINDQRAILAVLMDIREELRAVTARLDCVETLSIPRLLRKIVGNTTKRKLTPKLKVMKRRAA